MRLASLLLLCAVAVFADDGGKRLFIAHCAPCHGIDGSGGRGPNLVAGKLKRANTDEEILAIAREGIPGTIMDGAWQLSDSELGRIVAYVRVLGKADRVSLPGDAGSGERVYARNGCANCHIVGGQGGSFGPELTTVGARRSAAFLREAVLEPSKYVPDDFRLFTVQTKTGVVVRALRVNEDGFTIQLRDQGGRFYSYRKDELAKVTREDESAMPAYHVTTKDLDDLVAYLASLRGDQ